MLKISFLIKPSEMNAEGKVAVICRFRANATPKKEISSGIFVFPDQWDKGDKQITPLPKSSKTDKKAIQELNETLRVMETKVRQIYNRLTDLGKEVSSKMIKDEYSGKNKRKTTRDAFELLLRQYPEESNSYEKVKRFEGQFQDFLRDRFKVASLMLHELNEHRDLGIQFEGWSKERVGWKSSYAKKQFELFKRALRRAHKVGWLDRNPIEHTIKVRPSEVARKPYLTQEEVGRLKQEDLQNERRRHKIRLVSCDGIFRKYRWSAGSWLWF